MIGEERNANERILAHHFWAYEAKPIVAELVLQTYTLVKSRFTYRFVYVYYVLVFLRMKWDEMTSQAATMEHFI